MLIISCTILIKSNSFIGIIALPRVFIPFWILKATGTIGIKDVYNA
jgi:hypothetical protein